MRSFCLFIYIFCSFFFFDFSDLFAEEKSIGLRNSAACGLYLSSLVEDTEGLFRASLNADEIEKYLRSEQARKDLTPVLVFKDKKTRKKISDPVALEAALREDRAIPIINKKTVNIVGTPLTGAEKRRLKRLVKAIVDEQLADLEVRIRVLGRPEQPGLYAETNTGWKRVAEARLVDYARLGMPDEKTGIEKYFAELDEDSEAVHSYRLKGLKLRERFPILASALSLISRRRQEHAVGRTRELIAEKHSNDTELHVGWEKPLTYAFHRFVYFHPLPQDVQQFTADEISAGKTKLAINTPISVLSLSLTNPAGVVIPVALTNFAQSSATAAYSVVLANWFSRSSRDAHMERLGKNFFLSSFFTIPLYWAGRGSWEGFSAIASLAGWGSFIAKKWSTVSFNIFWRFFVSNGVYKWEEIQKEKADALRPEDFGSLEEFLDAKSQVRNYARATRARIETVASTIGTVGYLLAAVMPANYVPESWGWQYFEYGPGHIIMTGLGATGALFYARPELIDQMALPQRLEKMHEKITRGAEFLRASSLVQSAEKNLSAFYSRRAEIEAQEGHAFLGEGDIREYFSLDDSIEKMLMQNPNLIELINSNPRVHRLLRRHPEYENFVPH